MTAHTRARAGTTLVELLVVLAVLAAVGTLATMTLRVLPASGVDTPLARIGAARRHAVTSGRPVTLHVDDSGRIRQVRVFPDGQVLGAESLGIDPTSGRIRNAR